MYDRQLRVNPDPEAKMKNAWVLIVYMKDGSKRYIGPFQSRAMAQKYGPCVLGQASYEVEWLIAPFKV